MHPPNIYPWTYFHYYFRLSRNTILICDLRDSTRVLSRTHILICDRRDSTCVLSRTYALWIWSHLYIFITI